jgi:DNA-directed RNA polymerase subunit E"
MPFACKQCKRIVNSKKCNICGSDTTSSFQGIVVIFDTNSEIAKKLGITTPGKYAIKV